MSCSSETKVVQGSQEFLYADITADRVLDTQAVSMSISDTGAPGTWLPANWLGTPGKFRTAAVLLDGALAKGTYNVYARIVDTSETPIFQVGRLKVV